GRARVIRHVGDGAGVLEGAVGQAFEYVDVAEAVAQHEVRFAIVIEVAGGYGAGIYGETDCWERRLQGAITVAQYDPGRGAGDDVELVVAIEICQGDERRTKVILVRGSGGGMREAAAPVAHEYVDVVVDVRLVVVAVIAAAGQD